MLIQEQASELLKRCEALVGKELRQIRGDLRNAVTRAAAVWELLVIEAAAHIGPIEHEPLTGSSPDILLHLPNGRDIWIEATYLYPRFWQSERKVDEVKRWFFSEIKRRGIPSGKISIRIFGEQKLAGRIPNLPKGKIEFLKNSEIVSLFRHIALNPKDSYVCRIYPYTVFLSYNPDNQRPLHTSGGLVQETPISVEQHAVYRKLKDKARQFTVGEPLVVCIGSDQSHALSRLQSHPSYYDAVRAAFMKHHSLSAVILVAIELKAEIFVGPKRHVRAEPFINHNASNPLTSDEVNILSSMNFNRWKYVSPLEKYENNTNRMRRVTGSLIWRDIAMGLEIEIPANIVVDALAGKTSLAESYNLTKDPKVLQALNEGWIVVSCRMKEGEIEAGEAPKIVLELIPPTLASFWTKESKTRENA